MLSNQKVFLTLRLLSKGRISRVHYFLSTLGIAFFGVTLATLLSVVPAIGSSLAFVYVLGVIAFNLLFTIQRCHDLNLSGWYSLLSLIPLASLYFYFAAGTRGYNDYGIEPRACCEEAKMVTFAISAIFVVVSIVAITLYSYPVLNDLNESSLIANR
ncbi:MAG TPA: DUF805 domain-containing protein [Leucothrix sp.]|nr:DUF805 domain-containing protein [Leucothrix sp.]